MPQNKRDLEQRKMAAESAAGGDGQVDWMAGNDGSEREMVRTATDGLQGHLEHLVVIRWRLFCHPTQNLQLKFKKRL